jgi:hypothetical protein
MTTLITQEPSTADAEESLRQIMAADAAVLRRREEAEPRLSPEGVEAIRAARQRQIERTRKLRLATMPRPPANRRTAHA